MANNVKCFYLGEAKYFDRLICEMGLSVAEKISFDTVVQKIEKELFEHFKSKGCLYPPAMDETTAKIVARNFKNFYNLTMKQRGEVK